MKRGQATIFVILGIVIIALLISAYYIRTAFVKTTAEKKAVEESSLTVEETDVKNGIDGCISELAENAILYTAARGGYYRLPSKSESMNNVEIPYYLYKTEENVPAIETLQEQVALYIDANLEGCANENTKISIIGRPSSTATLTDTELKIETEMPVSIGGISERRISYFSGQIETRYKSVYEDAMEAYSKLSVIDNFLIVGLSELALNKDYEMRNSIEDEKIVTLLLYKNYKIKETPLRFNFAIMHDSAQRVAPDDVYSKNTMTEIIMGLQQLFAAKEITTDEDYEAEEAKYEGAILQSVQAGATR